MRLRLRQEDSRWIRQREISECSETVRDDKCAEDVRLCNAEAVHDAAKRHLCDYPGIQMQ